jgi:hypothetical protein
MRWSLSLLLLFSPSAQAYFDYSEDVVALIQTAALSYRRTNFDTNIFEDSVSVMEEEGKVPRMPIDEQAPPVRHAAQPPVRWEEEGAQSQLDDLRQRLDSVVMQRDQAMDLVKQSTQALGTAKNQLHEAVLHKELRSSTWGKVNFTDVGAQRSVVVVVEHSAIDAIVMIFGIAFFCILVAVVFLYGLSALQSQQDEVEGDLVARRIRSAAMGVFPENQPTTDAQTEPQEMHGLSAEEQRQIVERNRRMVAQGVFFGSTILLVMVFVVLTIYFFFVIKFYVLGWFVWADTKNGSCDAPLSLWLFLALVSFAVRTLLGGEANPFMGIFWLVWDIGLFIMGMIWINSSTTCMNTNGELYWFVHGFLVFLIVRNVIIMAVTFIALAVLVYGVSNGWFEGINAANPAVIENMQVANPAEFLKVPGAPTECSICCNAFDDSEEIKMTPCKHYFHTECLGKWLKNAKSCPLCRLDLQQAADQGGGTEAPV